ncbi:NADH dehydrogenase [Lentisphaera araneosa HTCC2155]|uniref:NADH:ubiquinone reductase (non-electrogenic) n=1 Tax=Lentisphaera araneosa HTCC2155 TaxID=313628 RepID=A6DLK3_9BACT|nr:NAD(P)/FAD-dependent oxidoreductase [Lentisphaera araneosa]EDM27458.1 NADH dehydrogenase [Lentisphaera araneosa HTCC2155]
MKKVVIIGGGFAGINAARNLGNKEGFDVTLIDRRNHHLFQPLLYQVAMAGLSPADIAAPIRTILKKYKNIKVVMDYAKKIDPEDKKVICKAGEYDFDLLIMACGARHSYFGHNEWEKYAPGLKTINQATEIRRRVFMAFEKAEKTENDLEMSKHLTFVIVGAGPTGVELAGAIGEMNRYTLGDEFSQLDVSKTRVLLIEAGPRILAAFDEDQSQRAQSDLVKLGVDVRLGQAVTHIDDQCVKLGDETIQTSTVLWAAGVEASRLGKSLPVELDRAGRVPIEEDLSMKQFPYIFVAGDQANFTGKDGRPLPGMAPVAMQQGRYLAKLLVAREKGKDIGGFKYVDKGKMATIGRSSAIAQAGKIKLEGFIAWLAWLFIHILYLSGFKNRFFVFVQWTWSYLSFHRGARLIIGKKWRFYSDDD